MSQIYSKKNPDNGVFNYFFSLSKSSFKADRPSISPNVDCCCDCWISLTWKVIAEAREGGNVGMFETNGDIRDSLIKKITTEINVSNILWEAPLKKQQVWFINNFGANVNLGNISPNSIISLECLRLGLRGDTFNNYL